MESQNNKIAKKDIKQFQPFLSSGSQWGLNFEPLQKANAELKQECAELKKRIILQGRVLIRRTHRFAGKVVK